MENRHRVHAAVTDANGVLLYGVGNPSRITLARSTAKPFQALGVLETGGVDQFGFDDADLALMCASHSSEGRHIARARAMLAKVNAEEGDLRCGGHPAISEAVNRAWAKKDFAPTPACSNCSGKHAGMLAGAKAIGAELTDYHLQTHLLQLRVQRVFEELCGLDTDGLTWSVDGCNLPAPAFPLHYLGKIYAKLAAAADDMERNVSSSERTVALNRIFHAMVKYPEMVAGEDRFCTLLMQIFQGALIGKLGADGCYGIGIRASETTKKLGAKGAIGISVKIEDGNIGILYSAVVEVLEQLGIGTREQLQHLAGFHHPKIFNTVGVVTGHTSHQFQARVESK